MLDVLASVAGWTILGGALGVVGLDLSSSINRFALDRRYRSDRLTAFRERSRTLLAIANIKKEGAERSWNGIRKFVVEKIVDEAADIKSFYLRPHDGKALPSFFPGQYLTFHLQIPTHTGPVIRCYSLSEAPGDSDRYRVTIKKVAVVEPSKTRPGVASGYFHQNVQEGDILNVRAPSGDFVLDLMSDKPVVLISGGIGVTPMLSMLGSLIRLGSRRAIYFFHGVKNKSEQVMGDHLRQMSAEHDNVRLVVAYSQPSDTCILGEHYDATGHLSVELMKAALPSKICDYYLCGPPGMMSSVAQGLSDWGVPSDLVHAEAFGPAAIRSAHAADKSSDAAAPVPVVFARSGKECLWGAEDGFLLDIATKHGVYIDTGCRAGSCGTCLTAIKSGKIRYLQPPGHEIEAGSCLACVAVPDGPLTIDV